MHIGVIGGGVVGRATARAFIEHVEDVRVYDVVKERRTATLDGVLSCDLLFICLPTPQKQGSLECDISALDDFFRHLQTAWSNWNWQQKNFVLRSTVPIGTTRKLREKYDLPNLIHSPEFLTARCAITDVQMPARNIIGSPRWERKHDYLNEPDGGPTYLLWDLYEKRFPGVPVHIMSSDESEAVKLMQNSFFAVKVAFWNECCTLTQKLGLDWERVLAAILADGRISHNHTKVPGPDGKRGFGGECLIKDLANFIQCLKDSGSLTFSSDVVAVTGFGTVDGVCQAAYERNLLDRVIPRLRDNALSDAETWERLNIDRLQLDKGLSIGQAMPDSEDVREGMVNPFDQ